MKQFGHFLFSVMRLFLAKKTGCVTC